MCRDRISYHHVESPAEQTSLAKRVSIGSDGGQGAVREIYAKATALVDAVAEQLTLHLSDKFDISTEQVALEITINPGKPAGRSRLPPIFDPRYPEGKKYGNANVEVSIDSIAASRIKSALQEIFTTGRRGINSPASSEEAGASCAIIKNADMLQAADFFKMEEALQSIESWPTNPRYEQEQARAR